MKRITSKFWSTPRRKVASVAGLLAVCLASLGISAWLLQGSGQASAVGGSVQNLVVTPNPDGNNEVFPYTDDAQLSYTVENPNDVWVKLETEQTSSLSSSPSSCAAAATLVDGGVWNISEDRYLEPFGSADFMTHARIETQDLANECQLASYEATVTVTAQTAPPQ